jgi:hypothetical protein
VRIEQLPSDITSVIVDLPQGFGMLIVHAEASRLGHEVEVQGADGRRQHAVVRRVISRDADSYLAIFPALRAGRYEVIHPEEGSATTDAIVTEGLVTMRSLT